MNRETLLMELPPFNGKWELIKSRQSVADIVREVMHCHEFFASHYDKIAYRFIDTDNVQTARNIFNFIRLNIKYIEESEDQQVIQSPAALLEREEGDCKMFASFVGGVLDAVNRMGGDVVWHYGFATYPGGSNHVFVVLQEGDREIWVDPVLERFNQRYPAPTKLTLKTTDMALYRLSGVGQTSDVPINMRGRRVSEPSNVGCAAPDSVGSIGEWVKANPGLTVALAVVAFTLLTSKRKRRARA
jgi:hypothetical protein